MKRPAAIKLISGDLSLDTIGYVSEQDDNLIFEFEMDGDRVVVTACEDYAAVTRAGEASYEMEITTYSVRQYKFVTVHGSIPVSIGGKKISVRKRPHPGLFIRFALTVGDSTEENVLTLKAVYQEESR